VLLAATRAEDGSGGPDDSVRALLERDAHTRVRDPDVLRGLEHEANARAKRVHDWLAAELAAGHRIIGYGAASRAVALLVRAGVDRRLLPAVADASPAKHGLRMPGTDIPVVDPQCLSTVCPDAVLLFLPDLLSEVTAAFPEVAASGARWVDVETLGA
jgi:hypothetical protein